MQELSDILRAHAARYPLMEPADAVKVIYQNEFGGGHLIRDEESCLAYLRREYALTPTNAAAGQVEQIGNGIVRISLAGLPQERVEELGRAFIRSAEAQQGSVDSFRNKLAVLRQLCAEGLFPFDVRALDGYLAWYEQAGFPAVSHSEVYRAAYRPAYRIVQEKEFSL